MAVACKMIDKIIYTIMLLATVIYLDCGSCLVHPFALYRSGLLSSSLTPSQTGGVVWFTLSFMWLKFAAMWRFGRCWAMLDGIDVPENMLRVWNNNYSIRGFWKGWHSSFNKWLVTYIYVPSGGRNSRCISVGLVFGFVAIWHDVEPKLLMWGGLNALFFIVEAYVAGFWREYKRRESLSEAAFSTRITEAASGATFIFVLMFVNALGYGVGISGTGYILSVMTEWSSLRYLAGSFLAFLGAAMVMLELRKIEQTWDWAEQKVKTVES